MKLKYAGNRTMIKAWRASPTIAEVCHPQELVRRTWRELNLPKAEAQFIIVMNIADSPITGNESISTRVRMKRKVSRACRMKYTQATAGTDVGNTISTTSKVNHRMTMYPSMKRSQPNLFTWGVRRMETNMMGIKATLEMVL